MFASLERKHAIVFPVFMALALMFAACREAGEDEDSGALGSRLRFEISFPAEMSRDPLDGRILLMLSTEEEGEPRFQIRDDAASQQIFGIDVEGLKPGRAAVVDGNVFGYPKKSLAEIPAGEYRVQALLHRYETFNRSDGYTLKLPMDRGEGQQWNSAPGNLLSVPQKIMVDPHRAGIIKIGLDQEIPPLPDPVESKYIKHVKIQSRLLTEFWGRPIHLGAHVLLPEGFEEHPEARYPLIINHGHFPADFGGFREIPADPDLEPDYSERFRIKGYNRIQQEEAYAFYQYWKRPDTPRFLIIEIQHANPYYDDSYAVNSANLGPYGDAITRELLPHIEERFRGIGKGWARFLYGGSTGGWEALGAQIFYPDEFNGCWAACPDPIDFRSYTLVNIYEHANAYQVGGPFAVFPRPGKRNYLGDVSTTVEMMNHLELVLGTNGRSGQQWDIWQAVFSPVGENGYPKPIWDKRTGVIDKTVVSYWKERYDLRAILERDWKTLGPKLKGKIHLYCGDMDNFYLNNAVYLMEEFLEAAEDPSYEGEVDYGDRAEHCWNGAHDLPNHLSRLRYHQLNIPKIMERIKNSAPAGADLASWRYAVPNR